MMQKISPQKFQELKSDLLNPSTSYTFEEYLKRHLDNYDNLKLLGENTMSEIFSDINIPQVDQTQPPNNIILIDSPFIINPENPIAFSKTAYFGTDILDIENNEENKEESKESLPIPKKEQIDSSFKIIPNDKIEEKSVNSTSSLKISEIEEKKIDPVVIHKPIPEKSPEQEIPINTSIITRMELMDEIIKNIKSVNQNKYSQPPKHKKKLKEFIISRDVLAPSSRQNELRPNQDSEIPGFVPGDMSYENLMLLNSKDYEPGKGFSFEVLSNLNQSKYIKVSEIHQICNICQDALDPGQTVSLLKCSHIFHYDCIYNWLSRKKKCAFNCELEENDFLYD